MLKAQTSEIGACRSAAEEGIGLKKVVMFSFSAAILIFSPAVFGFGPEYFTDIGPIPTPPQFWGTRWEGDGHLISIDSGGGIQFDDVPFSARIRTVASGGVGEWTETGFVYKDFRGETNRAVCQIKNRSVAIRFVDGKTSVTLKEELYERLSSSNGYFCRWLPDTRSYTLSLVKTYNFTIDPEYSTMSGNLDGRTLTLYRQIRL